MLVGENLVATAVNELRECGCRNQHDLVACAFKYYRLKSKLCLQSGPLEPSKCPPNIVTLPLLSACLGAAGRWGASLMREVPGKPVGSVVWAG